MKKLKRNLALSVGSLVLCLAPYQPTLADVISEGNVLVSYCFEIENLEKYPEYIFIAFAASESSSNPEDHAILNPNECFDSFVSYRPISRVYALPKSAVKQGEIIASGRRADAENFPLIYALPKTGVEQRNITATHRAEAGEEFLPQIKGLDEKDSRLIPSNLVIVHMEPIPIVSAGSRKFARVYEIVSLSRKQLELKEQRIIERPIERPIERKPQFSILGILFGGLVATGIAIFRRRKHPK